MIWSRWAGGRPLDHAPVYRDWRLPAAFGRLREQFEQTRGASAGARQFVRVLQLLASRPVERVQQAIEQCQPVTDADAITITVTFHDAGIQTLAEHHEEGAAA